MVIVEMILDFVRPVVGLFTNLAKEMSLVVSTNQLTKTESSWS